MSVYDKDLLTGRDKVETAVARIQAYCKDKRTLVAFSGGKDSQCCYHLAKMAGIPFDAQCSITRFEPPELMRFIREEYPDVKFRRAYKKSLVDEIAMRGLPNMWQRYCCDAKHKKTEGYDIAIVGIRWQESARRKARWSMFGKKQDGTYALCPICDWSENDVWEFLNTNNIPHCSLYDEGMKRIGCVCCPLNPSHMIAGAKRWPKTAAMLRLATHKNWEYMLSKGGKTKDGKDFNELINFKNADEMFDYWLSHGYTRISTTHKDELPCLFAGTGFSESDGAENQEDYK